MQAEPSIHCSGSLEYSLAFHCAPAMEGVKAANLISLNKARYNNLAASFRENVGALCRRGVVFYKLAECPKRVLLLVYQYKLLLRQLRQQDNAALLEEYGYRPGEMPLSAMLARLSSRIMQGEGYPHEIGVFLGYPPEDVKSFIHNRGEGFQLCGYWKVYHQPEKAKEIFHTYDTLRRYYCDQVSKGEKIHTIRYGGYDDEQGFGGLLVGNRQHEGYGRGGGPRSRGCHAAVCG